MDEKEEKRVIEINAVSMVATHLQSESPYGITQKYDRSLYDSPKARKEFHDEVFRDKKVITSSNGTMLHRSPQAARKKYKIKRAPQHQAQTDHVDPLKNIHQRHKKSLMGLFLKDSDIEEVGNRRNNLQHLSAAENASKGASSEIEVALDPKRDLILDKRVKRLAKGIKTQTETDILLTGKAIHNAGTEIAEGVKDALAASAIPLIIRGTQDLVKVANGEMSVEDAMEDVGKLGLSIAANGGGTRVASFALSTALKNSGNDVLQKLALPNRVGTILVAGSIIARAAGKYMSEEVDATGFFNEIGQDGLSLVSGMLASKAVNHLLVGGAASGVTVFAPVLAAMIASAACAEIYTQAKKLHEEKKDNETIRKIAEQASESIRQQQEELTRLLDQNHQQWVQTMTEVFIEIAEGLTNNNLQQTNHGLRNLMKTLHNREIILYESGEQAIDDLVAMRQGKNTC